MLFDSAKIGVSIPFYWILGCKLINWFTLGLNHAYHSNKWMNELLPDWYWIMGRTKPASKTLKWSSLRIPICVEQFCKEVMTTINLFQDHPWTQNLTNHPKDSQGAKRGPLIPSGNRGNVFCSAIFCECVVPLVNPGFWKRHPGELHEKTPWHTPLPNPSHIPMKYVGLSIQNPKTTPSIGSQNCNTDMLESFNSSCIC